VWFDAGEWAYSFTQEWPVGGVKHQFSWTALWLQPGSISDAGDGIGDLALNYRHQLIGDGTTAVAMSPRLSLLLPTGDPGLGRGSGAWGAQANIPLSVVLGPRVVSHINLGGTYLRGAEDALGNRGNLSLWSIGQSFIWLATPRVNAMLELCTFRREIAIRRLGAGRIAAHQPRHPLGATFRRLRDHAGSRRSAPTEQRTQALFLYLAEHPFTQAARSATPTSPASSPGFSRRLCPTGGAWPCW
jgi:hypothetical protein